MKFRVKLLKAEEITLQEMAINHRFNNTRRRATGLLMLARGDKPKVVCEALGVSDRAVYSWAGAWRIGGVCALMCSHNGGRPRALRDDVVAVALEIARAEPLTLAQIARRVEQAKAQALPCKIETLGEALKRAGFTFKRNRFSLKKGAMNRSSR
ncbi:transposase [Paraburkholderia sp. Clong3]|uniref:helix-turn-helix domain-containing protein n=1 Tax=unclassified Paraburkholderia TaxID=2615204 RepID=UPI00160B295B|nr:helix-turn-helix domain-containing protein [Paraburkholderia sp. CI2]MBB5470993.1 transposase [Paraburkholderia sp. CI2]